VQILEEKIRIQSFLFYQSYSFWVNEIKLSLSKLHALPKIFVEVKEWGTFYLFIANFCAA